MPLTLTNHFKGFSFPISQKFYTLNFKNKGNGKAYLQKVRLAIWSVAFPLQKSVHGVHRLLPSTTKQSKVCNFLDETLHCGSSNHIPVQNTSRK